MVFWYDVGMKKLVLFGDSLFAQAGKHRIIMFEEALPGYDVYNCAVGGWNTNDCVKKAPYISKLEPDVVVISLGTNDAAPYKQIPINTFIKNIPAIINSFKNSKLIWYLPTPIDQTKSKVFGKEIPNEVVKQYHDAAKKVCEEHGVDVINSFSIFMPMLDAGEKYHSEDGVHYIDKAYEIIANELSKLLN
jgi:lysophospholipase L1-like esterase